jgi:hypothetical protein
VKNTQIDIKKRYLLFLVLTVYIVIALCVDLLHNHEADFVYHQFCPACQWESQGQEDLSVVIDLLCFFHDPLIPVTFNALFPRQSFSLQSTFSEHPSRAPPSSVSA